MASLTYTSGVNALKSGYVRVGHNSSVTNKDAIWAFQPATAGAKAVTSVTFTLSWNNSSAGEGWSGSYTYAFAITGQATSGQIAASGSVLGRKLVTLSGSSGSTTFTISGLSLNPNTGYTYYLRANFNGTTTKTLKSFSKTGNTYSVASYTKPTCKVTFNRNTSTSDTTTTSKTYTYGTSNQKFPTPATSWTKNGYKRVGWSWERDYASTSNYTINNAVSDSWINSHDPSATLYLIWYQIAVKIKFDYDGATSYNEDTPPDVVRHNWTYISGNPSGGLTNPSTLGLAKTGYHLNKANCWKNSVGTTFDCDNLDLVGKDVLPSGTYSTDQTITLTANWIPNTYTVTFDAQGGTTTTSTKTCTYNEAYGTLPRPTYTGHSFQGWYTSAQGGTKITETSIHTTDGNVTLYAQWSQDITYNINKYAIGEFDHTNNGCRVYLDVDNVTIAPVISWAVVQNSTTHTAGTTYTVANNTISGSTYNCYIDITLSESAMSVTDSLHLVVTSATDDVTISLYTYKQILFSNSDGSLLSTSLCNINDTYQNLVSQTYYTKPGMPFLAGKYFDGWVTSPSSDTPVIDRYGTDSISENYISDRLNISTVQLFPIYLPVIYKVNYYNDDVQLISEEYSGDDASAVYLSIADGDISPTKTGYHVFEPDEWVLTSRQGSQLSQPVYYDPTTAIDWDALARLVQYTNNRQITDVFKVNWEIDTFIVTLVDSKNATTAEIQSNYGTIVTEYSQPTYENYVFKGWYTEDNINIDDTIVTSNITFYAKWEGISVVITLDPGEGVIEGDDRITLHYGDTYSTLPTPILGGAHFAGWYFDTAYTKLCAPTTIVTNSSPHSLYAKYSANIPGYYNNETISSIYVGYDKIISAYRGETKIW